jgi:hypothetical protein
MPDQETTCYRFEKIIFNKGLLDDGVDATYIIHLEGNGRYEDIITQLSTHQPTKTTYILFNKGFKKCDKKKHIKLASHDLVDAFLNIFKHADDKKYNNILILEDDYFFTESIYNSETRRHICDFLNLKKDENFQYLLGCMPILQIPYTTDLNHYISLASLGTHANIYSKKNRKILLEEKQKKIKDWDFYHWRNSRRYMFKKPICYQLFPDTENSKTWNIEYPIIFIGGKITKIILNFFLLDRQIEPGYSFFYAFSKILIFLIIILVLYIIYLIIIKLNLLKTIIPKKYKNTKI